MKEEWNLSNKVGGIYVGQKEVSVIQTKDVAEFVRRLKKDFWELFNIDSENQSDIAIKRRGDLLKFKDKIDKLVGDKLIEEKQK